MNIPFLAPQQLHIPDGFLSIPVSLVFWGLSILVIGVAARRAANQLDERAIPLMGIMAAFIFAGQMINFPIAGGTSGHLLGGVLAGVTLGPWSGILVMSTVIGLQALLFQDGGLLALGANFFNMGILTVVIGYGLYRSFAHRSLRTRLTAAGVAAWLSVLGGALLTALELWWSGTTSLQVAGPVLLGLHALIGLGEALITVSALSFIERSRPDMLTQTTSGPGTGWIAAGLLATGIVVLLAPLASANPDGLVRAAIDLGFASAEQAAPFQLLSGYTLPFLGQTALSTILAGLIGVAAVTLTLMAIGRFLRTRRQS